MLNNGRDGDCALHIAKQSQTVDKRDTRNCHSLAARQLYNNGRSHSYMMALITSRRFRQQHQLMTIDFFCDVSAKRKRWHLQPGWSQRSSSCRPWTFLYGRCNCIAKFGCCHDMLSVCLSVVCDASVTAFGKTNARYLFQPELASFKERFFCTLACLIHTTDTDKLRLFYPVLSCWWCEQNWLQDKTVFSSPHRISRLYKTGSKFSVADSLDLSPIRSTPLTRTRQDSLVLSVSVVWTVIEHSVKNLRKMALSHL